MKLKYKLGKKTYVELYDHFWSKGDIEQCKCLKMWYFDKQNKGRGGIYISKRKLLRILK